MEVNKQNSNENSILDLNEFIDCIVRRKLLISSISGIATLISLITAISKNHIWEGEFNILMRSSDKGVASTLDLFGSSSDVLKKFKSSTTNIENDIFLLKSPYVLKPIYEYVKDKENSIKSKSKMRFKHWEKKLKVKRKGNTKVLSVKYRDKDKKEIFEVLSRIVNKYKLYSLEEARANSKDVSEFLKNNLIKARLESKQTSRSLSKFELENSMIGRINYSEAVLGNASALENTIKNLEKDLLNKENKNDTDLNKIKRKISELNLRLNRINNNNNLILDYKELMNESLRKAKVRERLENEYLQFVIEDSKKMRPWELISQITISEYPVLPRKKRMVFLGLINGTAFGIFVSLLIDKLGKFIYSKRIIKNALKIQDSNILNLRDLEKINLFQSIIENISLNNSEISLLLINTEINEVDINLKNISKLCKEKNIIINKSIKDLDNKSNIILIISLKQLKKKAFQNMKLELSIKNINIKYLIFI